jgi:hypothetical protein
MRSIPTFLMIIFAFFSISAIAQPMEEYAKNLQTRIIDLEKQGEEYQSKLRYYKGLNQTIEQQKQKIRNLDQIRTKDKAQIEQQKKLLDEENKELKIMIEELKNVNKLLQETYTKLQSTVNELNKSKKQIDSLININTGLRYMIEEAMSELSGIKQLNLGIKRKDGFFVYKVEETKDNKTHFVCPRDIGIFNCDLTHASFDISFYDKNNLKESSFFLIIYEKDAKGKDVYHSHLPITMIETDSRYEDFHRYKSNSSGAIELSKRLPENKDYTIAVMELKSSEKNTTEKIMLSYNDARYANLIKATKTFVVRP